MCARQVGLEELLSDNAFLRLLDEVDSDAEDAVTQATHCQICCGPEYNLTVSSRTALNPPV